LTELLSRLAAGFRATTPLEMAAVLLGLVYVVLAVRRSRYCWIFGGLSSACLAGLASRSQLPMQAVLQSFYVLMAFYGFRRWTADRDSGGVRIGWWPWPKHLIACAAIAVLTLASARWLGSTTTAASPLLDSATTWGSLLATWLAARGRIENWLYWIVIDAALVVLYAAQGLVFTGLLYLAYLFIAAIGFITWLRQTCQPTSS